MIPSAFDYFRPQTLDEALFLLAQHHERGKVLAGGHSLIPAMKLRLAQPQVLIDLGRIADLSSIREQDGHIAIGARTPHHDIERSPLLREKCPLLTELAPQIGDVQVRHRGTIGGSLVHADPAGDWPAAILGLDAELEIASSHGRRTVKATEFFVQMMQTAVQPDEILCEIRVPATGKSVAYMKFAQKASGFAIAGAAVILDPAGRTVRVGVTGVAPRPYRATAVENALRDKSWTVSDLAQAATAAAEGIEPLNDIHASAEFRAHLAQVMTRRALERALNRIV